jgi:uncharacterized tellurite resistance protein B-like protein
VYKRIQEWFTSQWLSDGQGSSNQEDNLALATAVLLYEVMRSDDEFTASEERAYRLQLEQHFSLSHTALDTLCELTQEKAENAVDFQQFTKVLNEMCTLEQKRAIMESLWSVAYADHKLSADEEYTIRKIADLLFVPHSQFIQSKLTVQEQQH